MGVPAGQHAASRVGVIAPFARALLRPLGLVGFAAAHFGFSEDHGARLCQQRAGFFMDLRGSHPDSEEEVVVVAQAMGHAFDDRDTSGLFEQFRAEDVSNRPKGDINWLTCPGSAAARADDCGSGERPRGVADQASSGTPSHPGSLVSLTKGLRLLAVVLYCFLKQRGEDQDIFLQRLKESHAFCIDYERRKADISAV